MEIKQVPVARTGSRSRTCRSDISLGSFSYISCLKRGGKSTVKINYIQFLKNRKHGSSSKANYFFYKITQLPACHYLHHDELKFFQFLFLYSMHAWHFPCFHHYYITNKKRSQHYKRSHNNKRQVSHVDGLMRI